MAVVISYNATLQDGCGIIVVRTENEISIKARLEHIFNMKDGARREREWDGRLSRYLSQLSNNVLDYGSYFIHTSYTHTTCVNHMLLVSIFHSQITLKLINEDQFLIK